MGKTGLVVGAGAARISAVAAAAAPGPAALRSAVAGALAGVDVGLVAGIDGVALERANLGSGLTGQHETADDRNEPGYVSLHVGVSGEAARLL